MKKLIALLLALAMLFALCACGKTDPAPNDDDDDDDPPRITPAESSTPVWFSNTRTTPVQFMEKYANAKTVDYIKMIDEAYNGVDKGNMAKILKIMAKSDEFKDFIEDFEADWKDDYEDKVADYGKNFKITYRNDKEMEEKLDRDDLKDYRSEIKYMGQRLLDIVAEINDMDKDEQKDVADDMGISYSDLKDMVKYMQALGKELKSANVDEGYELEVITTITGKELDEPEEDEIEIIVLKVNGMWISIEELRFFDILKYFI